MILSIGDIAGSKTFNAQFLKSINDKTRKQMTDIFRITPSRANVLIIVRMSSSLLTTLAEIPLKSQLEIERSASLRSKRTFFCPDN